jgi:hypothetical protein
MKVTYQNGQRAGYLPPLLFGLNIYQYIGERTAEKYWNCSGATKLQ